MNKIFTLLILLSVNLINSQIDKNQDLYSLENSKKYASFLFEGAQYNLAAEEYERLIFLDSLNESFMNKLIKSYYLSGNRDFALKKINILFNKTQDIPEKLVFKYLVLLQEKDSLEKINYVLKINRNIPNTDKFIFKWGNYLLYGDTRKALKMLELPVLKNNTEIVDITNSVVKQKRKSPFVAGVLSTVVPGLGKVYTGRTLDGLFSLIFIAGNAYQSYKGFEKNGVKSTTGWVFGSLGVGFYLGNIYGSIKSAIKYNKRKKDETKNKVRHYFYVRYF